MRIKTYEDIIDNKEDVIFIDVRTKKEFEEETIPCSINIPIFTDEERVTIGTLYKKDGPRVAMEVGIKCVSEKLPEIFNKIIELDKQRKTMVFFLCKRWYEVKFCCRTFFRIKI